jgi:hypothetical protein
VIYPRPLISLYAHETQQKYSSLNYFDRRLSMGQFFHEFVKGKLAADNMLKDKKIEIRFVFFIDKVVSQEIFLSRLSRLKFTHSFLRAQTLMNHTGFLATQKHRPLSQNSQPWD